MHLGHGPRVDHLPKNEDGSFKLGSEGGSSQPAAGDQGDQEGQKNPWRGPGGMKLGHGPRVDHLPKNPDGTYRLREQSGGEGSVGGGHAE